MKRLLSVILAITALLLACAACSHQPGDRHDEQRTAQSVADSLLRADSLSSVQDSLP